MSKGRLRASCLRTTALVGSLCLALWANGAAAQSQTFNFDMPAQKLSAALREYAQISGQQIIFTDDLVAGREAPALHGNYSATDALAQLLEGTGLVVEHTSSGAIMVRKKNSQAAESEGAASGVEIVIVTAEKREENIQNTPVPVTVLKGENLAQNNLNRLEDYFASVPGLSLLGNGPYGNGGPTVEIRGLSSSGFPGGQTPTVSFIIDDSVFGSSQFLPDAGQTTGLPDIDPSDIERIEVLKGPQGTLYGADAIGGVIKIVTKDPSTDGYGAHIQVISDGIPDGGIGYTVRASANIPVSDDFAFRMSGFSRRDPGYIDDVETGQTNVNSADVYGARIAALWRPADNLSLKLSALIQNDFSNGNGIVNADSEMQPTLGDLKQTGLPAQNLYQVRAFNGTLNAEFAGVSIVSATGYDIQIDKHNQDLTSVFSSYATKYFPPAAGVEIPSDWTDEKLSQEIRFSSSIGHWANWLVGGFYTHENNTGITDITANNAVTGATVGSLYIETAGHLGDGPTTLSEEAVFADLTFHLTDRFDIQVGGRESWYQQVFNHAYFGPATVDFAGAPASGVPVFQTTDTSNGSDFTYLMTPEYTLSPDLMVYVRVATGFQLGGANQGFSGFQVPATYAPSTTKNYEIGTKGSLDDGRITFDLSAYYIDWSAIQISVNTGAPDFDGYETNGGRAKSEGLELSLQANPVDGLHISAVGSYNNAVLTSNFPANASSYGPKGAPLPTSMRLSGSLTGDLDVAHFGETTAFVGATANYIGKRYGDFAGSLVQVRLIYPAFATVNLHAGLRCDEFALNFYINNLSNERGIIAGDTYYASYSNATGGYFAQIISPRTIGLSLTKDF